MEQLDDYLSANGIRQAEFAETIEVTQATVSKLIGGSVTPSLALALRIQRATNGAVPCEVWLPAADKSQTGGLSDEGAAA